MKKAILLFSLISFTLAGHSQQTLETIDIAGNQRTYYQYLPTGFNSSEVLPVIVVLHGIGDNALNMSGVGFNQMADTARFIPVYLQGEQNGFSQNSWNNGTLLGSSANDVLFISAVIDRLEDSIDVDLSRVYITGFSMGGIMSYTACSQLSDRIAGMVSFSGTMSQQEIGASGQTFPVPTMHVHGTVDSQVPYDGAPLPSLSLVNATMDKNKTLNGWAGDSTITVLPDNAADGVTIEKIVYNTTTPLEHWKMNGADHIWPYQPVNDTSAIFAAWYFFMDKTHPNPSTASIEVDENPLQLKAFPNPVSDEVQIQVGLQNEQYTTVRILDMLGNVVAYVYEGNLAQGTTILNYSTSELPAGIYFVQVNSASSDKALKLIKQ